MTFEEKYEKLKEAFTRDGAKFLSYNPTKETNEEAATTLRAIKKIDGLKFVEKDNNILYFCKPSVPFDRFSYGMLSGCKFFDKCCLPEKNKFDCGICERFY